jgi:fatty acid desaturase
MGAASRTESPTSLEEEIRALRNDHRNVALPGLAATYLALGALVVGTARADTPLVYACAAIPIGVLQYRVTLSGHEAVHRTLVWPGWLNEALGIVGQALVGVNFASYRVQHLDHHRATTLPDDPDGHIYGGILRTPRGWRRTVAWTLGTFVEIAIKVWQKGFGSIGRRHAQASTVATVGYSRACSVAVLLAQCLLAWGCARLTGHWWGYAAVWVGPLFAVAVFLNRTRILVEHGLPLLAGVPAVARGIPTVDLDPPAVERWIVGPFHFHHHCAHHLHLAVPHYNLPALARSLRAHGHPDYHHVVGSYVTALTRAMRT